jgi:hypothetical protein
MRLLRCLPFVLALLLSGCAEEPAPAEIVATEPEPVDDPWEGSDRIVAVDWHAETTEFDIPACVGAGSGFALDREGPIPAGTERLEVTVQSAQTHTGVQAGYSFDRGKTITWLPTVHGGPETFVVLVAPEQWETDEDGSTRWSFHHQMNLPEPASQDCYTGGGSGRWDIVVEAVKGATADA